METTLMNFTDIMGSERSQTQWVYSLGIHVYEIQKQAKLAYGIRSQSNGYLWRWNDKKDSEGLLGNFLIWVQGKQVY